MISLHTSCHSFRTTYRIRVVLIRPFVVNSTLLVLETSLEAVRGVLLLGPFLPKISRNDPCFYWINIEKRRHCIDQMS